MLTSGDIVELDLGVPSGREAGFRHPAVAVTAQRILDASPSVIQVVPLTTTIRGFRSEIEIEPDQDNNLGQLSAAVLHYDTDYDRIANVTNQPTEWRTPNGVYDMRMARVNVYLPDELAIAAKEAGLNVSGLTQDALRSALSVGQIKDWLDEVAGLRPTGVDHETALLAVAAAKEELEGRGSIGSR